MNKVLDFKSFNENKDERKCTFCMGKFIPEFDDQWTCCDYCEKKLNKSRSKVSKALSKYSK